MIVCYDMASGVAYDARPFDPATVAKLLAGVRAALPAARFALETAHRMVREPDYELSVFDQDGDDAGRRVVAYDEVIGVIPSEDCVMTYVYIGTDLDALGFEDQRTVLYDHVVADGGEILTPELAASVGRGFEFAHLSPHQHYLP